MSTVAPPPHNPDDTHNQFVSATPWYCRGIPQICLSIHPALTGPGLSRLSRTDSGIRAAAVLAGTLILTGSSEHVIFLATGVRPGDRVKGASTASIDMTPE